MNKKNITILLVFLVAVLGLFFFLKNQEDNLTFENNLKCAKYIEQKNKEVDEVSKLPVNDGKVVTAPKIFFSKKLNTCVAAFSIIDFRDNGFSSFYIENLLNNDSILTEGGPTESAGTIDGAKVISRAEIAEQKYMDKLKEIGGE